MSNKITKKTINEYLRGVNEHNDNEIKLEYSIDKDKVFEIKLRKRLDLERKSKFINIVAGSAFSGNDYKPEYEDDLRKVAFFECFVKNIDTPLTQDKEIDVNKIVNIVDGFELMQRYITSEGEAYLWELYELCEKKIDYNKGVRKSVLTANILKDEIITNLDVILRLFEEAIQNIDSPSISPDMIEEETKEIEK